MCVSLFFPWIDLHLSAGCLRQGNDDSIFHFKFLNLPSCLHTFIDALKVRDKKSIRGDPWTKKIKIDLKIIALKFYPLSRVSEGTRKTAIANNFPKTNRIWVQFLHLYRAKTDLIDIRLLWPLITRKKHSRTWIIRRGIDLRRLFWNSWRHWIFTYH